jgi:8-oxo-dGTP pyrophosphatase MutT (NUDIX family)
MTVEKLIRRLQRHRTRRLPGRRWFARAVVGVVLRDDAQRGPCVLLMRRAERAGDPWSGHMSFPGGRMDARDRHGLAGVIREVFEETGLVLEEAHCVGRLSDVMTRRHERPAPMLVTPYVFRVEGEPEWKPSHEAVETIWVPLEFLADDANRKIMYWPMGPLKLRLPSFVYEERRIWGLTLLMLRELLRVYRTVKES